MADSIREALSQAFAEDEKNNPPPAAEPVAEITPAQSIADPAAPVIGAEAPPAAEPKPATPAQPAAASGTPAVSPPGDKPAASPTGDIAAPASWKAAEKAFWDKIPNEARAAIQRRELETQRALSSSAEARKGYQAFREAMNPYQPLLDAYGVKDPVQALIPLMQTRAALEVGTPAQKAQLLSNLVYQFGIDIKMLDEHLSRGPQAQVPVQQQPSFDPKTIPELAPLFQLADQFKSVQEKKVDDAIAEASSLPQFEELREDIADILELAAQRGKPMTLKEAHSLALQLTPGSQPAATSASVPVSTSEAAAILARSRKAASSVAVAPKGAPGSAPKTLRDTIVAAMEG